MFSVDQPNCQDESIYRSSREPDFRTQPLYRSIYAPKVRSERWSKKVGVCSTIGPPKVQCKEPSAFLTKHANCPPVWNPKGKQTSEPKRNNCRGVEGSKNAQRKQGYVSQENANCGYPKQSRNLGPNGGNPHSEPCRDHCPQFKTTGRENMPCYQISPCPDNNYIQIEQGQPQSYPGNCGKQVQKQQRQNAPCEQRCPERKLSACKFNKPRRNLGLFRGNDELPDRQYYERTPARMESLKHEDHSTCCLPPEFYNLGAQEFDNLCKMCTNASLRKRLEQEYMQVQQKQHQGDYRREDDPCFLPPIGRNPCNNRDQEQCPPECDLGNRRREVQKQIYRPAPPSFKQQWPSRKLSAWKLKKCGREVQKQQYQNACCEHETSRPCCPQQKSSACKFNKPRRNLGLFRGNGEQPDRQYYEKTPARMRSLQHEDYTLCCLPTPFYQLGDKDYNELCQMAKNPSLLKRKEKEYMEWQQNQAAQLQKSSIVDRGQRDFLRENALKAVRMPPKRCAKRGCYKGHKGNQREDLCKGPFVLKEGFGQVPKYLQKRKEEVNAERLFVMRQMSAAKNSCRLVGASERCALIEGLLGQWEAVNKEYLNLPTCSNSDYSIRRKGELECQLKDLEKNLRLFQANQEIYVKEGDCGCGRPC